MIQEEEAAAAIVATHEQGQQHWPDELPFDAYEIETTRRNGRIMARFYAEIRANEQVDHEVDIVEIGRRVCRDIGCTYEQLVYACNEWVRVAAYLERDTEGAKR